MEAQGPDFVAWANPQNAVTRSTLDTLPGYAALVRKVAHASNADTALEWPRRVGEMLYYEQQAPGEDQASLYGGIMIGRAITEAPDLLAGAVIWAPISNTLRFETTEGGPANTMAWDFRSLGYVHRVTWASSAAVVAVEIVTPLIWATPAWLAFAGFVSAPFR